MSDLETLWTAMNSEKGDLTTRAEQYAKWTIPAVCPEDDTETTAMVGSYVVIGARLLNVLSNKVVSAMFPLDRPFFMANMATELQNRIRKTAGDEALAQMKSTARQEAQWVETLAMDKFDLVQYRPAAVEMAQQLIVTGNVCKVRLDDGTAVVYGIKDFCVRRSLNGKPYDVLTRDRVLLDELPLAVQTQIREKQASLPKTDDATSKRLEDKLWLYTRFVTSGKIVTRTQECEGVAITDARKRFALRDNPAIVLAWSLARNRNYGRGICEEHANLFHNLDKSGEALFDIFQISADIKFVVNPASLLDVVQLNNSKRGTYHSGSPDDVGALTNDTAKELQILMAAVQGMEQELSRIMLAGAGSVRDAERVTAFEVQLNALELESAFGGLYSRLALEWQKREADYLIGTLNIPSLGKKDLFDIKISAGVESLSKESVLQQVRAAFMDLQLLDAVPEDMRAAFDPSKVAQFMFGQRGIDYKEFLKSSDQIAAEQQQAQQQQQDLVAQEAAAKAATQPEA